MARFAHVLPRLGVGVAAAGVVSLVSAPALAAPVGPSPAAAHAALQPTPPPGGWHAQGPPPPGGPPPPPSPAGLPGQRDSAGPGGPSGPEPGGPGAAPPPAGATHGGPAHPGAPSPGGTPAQQRRNGPPPHPHLLPARHVRLRRIVELTASAGDRHDAVAKARALCARRRGAVAWVASHPDRGGWVGVVGCRV
jgi:hypothetical protein